MDDLSQKHPRMPIGPGNSLLGIQERYGDHDPQQQREIDAQTGDLQLARLGDVTFNVCQSFFGMVIELIRQAVGQQQQAVDHQPGFPQTERPGEFDAFQVSEKQGWIANRQQASAAIADNKDKENDGVVDVFALFVRLQQRANQQHCRSGGADEAGQQSADGHERGVGERVGLQIAFDANPAGDRIEAKQQDDERDILGQDRVTQDRSHKADLHGAVRHVDRLVGRPMGLDG